MQKSFQRVVEVKVLNKICKIFLHIFCLTPLIGCDGNERKSRSDHFDGKKYYNPTLQKQFSPGLSDIYQMMREGRPDWPDRIENKGVSQLDATLGPDDFSLTFVNHATFLIQFAGVNVLTDPVWSERASPVSWIGPKRVRKPGIPISKLPNIDLILISHNHYDHLDIKTLKLLSDKFNPVVVVPIGDKKLLNSVGIRNVKELDWWESISMEEGSTITFTPTQHSSARGLFDRDKSLWGSYFIKYRQRSIYFGGDAGYSSHFSETRKRLGPPDVALLGIGAYAPRFFMKSIHMDPAEAVLAHKDLGANQSVGMHFGTFQLSSESFDQPLKELGIALLEQGVKESAFTTLQDGETRLFLNN
ncbi:MBL fold metallo-hydrolase [Planctobacterium marinum]|uniref:MBL fold metallo-hydrolase n=1 Tax=Planctobacterium marinum TaxID=1631968 RepID=UPI0030DA1B88